MSHHPPRAAILLIPVLVAIVLTLFAWPNARLGPRDLPIGVAGPSAAAAAIEHKLAQQQGAFEVHRYANARAARTAIEDREVYGAVIATPNGPSVLTASAASTAVAQLLTHAAEEMGPDTVVADVVPASPRSAALAASVLPLVLAGIVTGLAAAGIASSRRERLALVVLGSALAGVAAAAVVQSWLEVVEGDWAANAGSLALTVLAIAVIVAGLEALVGKAGAAIAALTMVLIGNPFSGVATAPEMLPQPVGALGQLLPPGAGGNLLRSTGFFDGAGASSHVLVLAAWTVLGTACLLLARRRPDENTTTQRDSDDQVPYPNRDQATGRRSVRLRDGSGQAALVADEHGLSRDGA
jgi:hypothetical protein